jgi:predicted ATP-dependent protease
LKRSTKSGIKETKSPMAEIEPYILNMIIQLANMRLPITTSQGLQLCNSIIKGTKYESYINDLKKNAQEHNSRTWSRILDGVLTKKKAVDKSKKGCKI